MGRTKYPVTQAVRALRAADISYTPHLYRYVDRGGTRVSSQELGVEEHCVIKTLVFEDDASDPLIILMHGDAEVAPGLLARAIGARRTRPVDPNVAQKHTGYLVGGTSPFGTRKPLPIYAESSIQALDRLYINGGKRGFLVSMTPEDLASALEIAWVEAAQPPNP